MSAKKSWFYKLSIAAAVFGLVAISSVLITGEPASQTASPHHVGMVEDWSSHRLVFSNPGTYEQVKNNPEAYSRWLTNPVRYALHLATDEAQHRSETTHRRANCRRGLSDCRQGPTAHAGPSRAESDEGE